MTISDLRTIAPTLTMDPRGIWIASGTEAVSYPEGCAEVLSALEGDSFWFAHRNECIAALIERYPPAGTIFDIGGGNGFVASALVARGHDAVLVEPGLTGALNAHERGLERVVCATLADAQFAPGSLPAVGLFDVVEHTPDDVAFLSEVVRVLAPGGRVYLTVPAHRWLWSEHDVDAGHFRRYTQKTLSSALAAAGLHLEWQTPFFAALIPPVFFMRAVPKRLGLARPVSANEHQEAHVPSRFGARMAHAALSWEPRWIAAGRSIPAGASLLAVARK